MYIFHCWNFDNASKMSFTNRKIGQVDFCQQKLVIQLWIGCVKPIDLAFACELELELTIELEAKFHANAIDHDDFLNLNEVKFFFPSFV